MALNIVILKIDVKMQLFSQIIVKNSGL